MGAKRTVGAEARWRTLIAAQERSGLSVAEFADRRGLKAATLYWWRSRLRRGERPEPRIVSVELFDSQAESVREARHFELELAGGRRLRVPQHFDADELARLIAVLERAC